MRARWGRHGFVEDFGPAWHIEPGAVTLPSASTIAPAAPHCGQSTASDSCVEYTLTKVAISWILPPYCARSASSFFLFDVTLLFPTRDPRSRRAGAAGSRAGPAGAPRADAGAGRRSSRP